MARGVDGQSANGRGLCLDVTEMRKDFFNS